MFILGYFLTALASLLDMVLSVLFLLLVVRMIMSWMNPDPFNDVVRMICRMTDPILNPIRRVVKLQMGMIDFAPMLAFMLLYFVQGFLVNVLMRLGKSML